MKVIPLIEGFRRYLSLWVVFDHLLAISGYGPSSLNYIFALIRSGWYAVDVFIIISGFVIFYLLDSKRENYKSFIVRRFFRLWPLFILLFFISIPLAYINIYNVSSFSEIYGNSIIGDGFIIERFNSYFQNIVWHILFHLPMLHGIIPNSIIPFSPGAFLGPAWSISLEWQFYIVAPLLFFILKRFKKLGVIILSVLFIILYYWGKNIDDIQFGAFLPMHIEYFFIGIVSYFIFKHYSLHNQLKKISLYPFILLLSGIIFYIYNFKIIYFPIFIWINFFAILIDYSTKRNLLLKPIFFYLFEIKFVKFLGKISYSIYLSHFLIIYVVQFLILNFFPNVAQKYHLLLLTLIVLPITIYVSNILYNKIELPGVRFGNLLASKIDK